MTKNELKALIDETVQRQGTQGAIKLAPILNEIIDLIPDSTVGRGGGGVPIVEIELPAIENYEHAIYPNSIQFEIPAEKAEIFEKNQYVIIAAKDSAGDIMYFRQTSNGSWRYLEYNYMDDSQISPNIYVLQIQGTSASFSIVAKSTEVVNSVTNAETGDPFAPYLVSTTTAVYNEIHKTK